MHCPTIAVARIAAILAAVTWTCTLLACGAAREGYAQSVDPVALLGAAGSSGAALFNVAGFMVPGALAAAVAWCLRDDMPATAPWAARIGAWLVLLSAVGFTLQGVFPIDARDLDAGPSRAHALAWTLWWVAFVPGALLYAVAMPHIHPGARRRRLFAVAGIALAITVPWFATLATGHLPAAVAQRVAFGAWFAWLLLASYGARRRSAQP